MDSRSTYLNLLSELKIQDGLSKCGSYKIDRAYSKLAIFDEAYNQLANNDFKYGHDFKLTNLVKTEINNNGRNSNASKGGNFLALPGGTLIVGKNGNHKAESSIVNHFENNGQKVLQIEIPVLEVAHIDEIFKIIPADNACGFKMLMASPIMMKNFIQNGKHAKQNIDKSKDFPKNHYSDVLDLKDEMQVLRGKIKELKEESRFYDHLLPKLLNIIKQIDDKVKYNNITIQTHLDDPETMQFWRKSDDLILSSAKKILSEINSTNPNCKSTIKDHVVKLPVYWNKEGKPLLPNPVNGLSVNGKFFYSKHQIDTFADENQFDHSYNVFLKDKFEDFTALEQYVQKLLKPHVKEFIPVETPNYNSGSGNFHCATNNVFLPCK